MQMRGVLRACKGVVLVAVEPPMDVHVFAALIDNFSVVWNVSVRMACAKGFLCHENRRCGSQQA